MIKGIEHVGLAAKDSKALADWYARLFSGRIVMDNGAGAYFVMFGNGVVMEIYPAGDTPVAAAGNSVQGLRHTCFIVEGIDGERDRLLKEEKVQPLNANAAAGASFFFYDPEGNIVQLIQRDKPLA